MFEFLHERAMESVLSLVERQRNGERVGYREIRNYVDSFVALNIEDLDNLDNALSIEMYKAVFEKPFCLASLRYYQQESAQFLADHSVVEYMKMAEDRLRDEEYHTSLYLLNELTGPLIQACEQALILDHLDFIHEEFTILLQCDDRGNLSRMYQLLSRVPGGLDPLRTQFESHIVETGLKKVEYALEVKDILEPSDYVAALSPIITKYKRIVSEVFDQEAEFTRSFNKACQRIVNRNKACKSNPTKSSELLALYTNILLMHSSPAKFQEELQVSIHEIITLFTHLEDKDAFQRFYSRKLGYRLLYTATVNEDAERILISHMKDACDVKLFSASQTMLQDLQISRELNSSFGDFCVGHPPTEDFSIDESYRVLSSAKAWHLKVPDTEFTPPLAVAQRCERFSEFYKTQEKGRKLTWLWQLCKGEVLANYILLNGKPYQFCLSAYQMAILLLFNDADEVSYEDMEISIRLVRSILVPSIESLVKLKVLKVHPPGLRPAEASFYSLNNEFRSKKIKVSLHITSKSERRQEAEDTQMAISKERRLLIKCTAVRTMKFRKQMSYRELASEVTRQLRSGFTPTTSDVKTGIEDLIKTEFLKRLDKECLGYIA